MKCFFRNEFIRWWGVGMLAIVLGGCQSRPAAEVHYYILQPVERVEVGAVIVSVLDVRLPAYLQTSSVILGVSDMELRPAQYHRWSEPLEEGIRRVLNAEVNRKLGDEAEELSGVGIEIKIETFHGAQAGAVNLLGSWKSRLDGAVWKEFRIEAGLRADGYPELVRAHVVALERLAEQVAAELSKR
ncbi:conserved hypothetical protein [Verrucomicrobiia bacterium DG1235]|nr:conserved hypothetical protein [Verrucomicrobiae bacterium DG1235]